jgi:hypothetical protein
MKEYNVVNVKTGVAVVRVSESAAASDPLWRVKQTLENLEKVGGKGNYRVELASLS